MHSPYLRLVLLLGALSFARLASAAGNYSQNFQNLDPATWATWYDNWEAVAGEYRNLHAVIPPALSFYLGNTWTSNFTYKVTARSDYASSGNELGVVFGLTDANNYFAVVVSMDGVVDLLRASGNASSPSLIASGNVPASIGLSQDTDFELVVFVNGNSVIVKVKGKVVPLVYVNGDPHITPVLGKIGVISRANHAHFDNLSITDNEATQLFSGTFMGDDGSPISLTTPTYYCSGPEKACYAKIVGNDSSGFHWPFKLWGDGDDDPNEGGMFHYMSRDTTGPVTDFAGAIIEEVPGHNPDGSDGAPTHVLHTWLRKKGNVSNPQLPYAIRPNVSLSQHPFLDQGDLYARFWMKFPYGLTGAWQMPFQFMTGGDFNRADPNNLDPKALRVSLFATTWQAFSGITCTGATGNWHWVIQGDRNPDFPIWQQCHSSAEVPFRKWFKVEIWWHRARAANQSGRVWVAIDGQTVLDRTVTPSEGQGMYADESPIVRLNLPQTYGGDTWQRHQYVDDLEFWDAIPADATRPNPRHAN